MGRRPLEPELTIFLDENLDGDTVAGALRSGGHTEPQVEPRPRSLGRSIADAAWLPVIAARGWAIATRDGRMRHRTAERAAMLQAGAMLVVLRGVGLRGATMASMLIDAYPALRRIVSRYQAPLIVHVYADGSIKLIENAGRRGPTR